MGVRIGLLFLLVLSTSWATDARELVITDHSSGETLISHVSALQVNHHKSEWEVQSLTDVDRIEEVCTKCEEFAGDALKYLSDNKTQTEVVHVLHKACSRLFSFKQECVTLVDYYAHLFFLEISSVQPEYICQKVNLCGQMVFTSREVSKDSCELCHYAVAEVLLKLKDPDTELEIIELLLKGCDAVDKYVKKCKRLVFEYGPLILANAEQFLETTDICTALHACTAGDKEASSMDTKPMFSDS